jgi:hypothetical protein
LEIVLFSYINVVGFFLCFVSAGLFVFAFLRFIMLSAVIIMCLLFILLVSTILTYFMV